MQMWGSMFAAPSVLPSGFFFSARAGAHPHFLIAQDAGRPWAQPSTPDRPHPHSSQLYSEVHCDWCGWGGRLPSLAGAWRCPSCGESGFLYGGPRARLGGAVAVKRVLTYLALIGAFFALSWTVCAALGWVPFIS